MSGKRAIPFSMLFIVIGIIIGISFTNRSNREDVSNIPQEDIQLNQMITQCIGITDYLPAFNSRVKIGEYISEKQITSLIIGKNMFNKLEDESDYDFAVRVVDTTMQNHNVNLYISYIKNRNLHIKSNIEKNRVVPKPPKPNRQATGSTELRARIKDISTPESVVYNARKSLQMYPHSKNHQRNWERIRRKYLPVLGSDRFYKVMELADMDSF